MSEQLIFVDESGEPFRDLNPPEAKILQRIRDFIDSGKPFRFEDCLRGIETPQGKDRRGYSYLLRPLIESGEIIKIGTVYSSEPAHHWGWKTRWVRTDCLYRCPVCRQPRMGGHNHD